LIYFSIIPSLSSTSFHQKSHSLSVEDDSAGAHSGEGEKVEGSSSLKKKDKKGVRYPGYPGWLLV
jgi:hypothetical protein